MRLLTTTLSLLLTSQLVSAELLGGFVRDHKAESITVFAPVLGKEVNLAYKGEKIKVGVPVVVEYHQQNIADKVWPCEGVQIELKNASSYTVRRGLEKMSIKELYVFINPEQPATEEVKLADARAVLELLRTVYPDVISEAPNPSTLRLEGARSSVDSTRSFLAWIQGPGRSGEVADESKWCAKTPQWVLLLGTPAAVLTAKSSVPYLDKPFLDKAGRPVPVPVKMLVAVKSQGVDAVIRKAAEKVPEVQYDPVILADWKGILVEGFAKDLGAARKVIQEADTP